MYSQKEEFSKLLLICEAERISFKIKMSFLLHISEPPPASPQKNPQN